MSNKVQRNHNKMLYRNFAKTWTKERARQDKLIAAGELSNTDPLRLHRKPTFSEWLRIAKSAAAKATATPAEVKEFIDETNLAWEDDEDVKNADKIAAEMLK